MCVPGSSASSPALPPVPPPPGPTTQRRKEQPVVETAISDDAKRNDVAANKAKQSLLTGLQGGAPIRANNQRQTLLGV